MERKDIPRSRFVLRIIEGFLQGCIKLKKVNDSQDQSGLRSL